jgi:cytochrome c553
MERNPGVSKRDDPWPWIGWSSVGGLVVVSVLLGFLVLPRYQQNGPTFDIWNAICRGLGITADTGPAGEPQPTLRTPTRIAWTSATLARIASGNAQNGANVALNCSACHGDQGVSPSSLVPTLGGMDAAAVYKQLDDFRSSKRLWDVMNGIAAALTDQETVDVVTYFASRAVGLPPVSGEGAPEAGHSLRQTDPAIRLVFAGDPERGIPPCAACHGPGGHKLGAPALQGQHFEYIERQLGAFAQGMRQNDINQQMRTIAKQLTPAEMHAIAVLYGSYGTARTAKRRDP